MFLDHGLTAVNKHRHFSLWYEIWGRHSLGSRADWHCYPHGSGREEMSFGVGIWNIEFA